MVGIGVPLGSVPSQLPVCVLQNWALEHWLSAVQPDAVPLIEMTWSPVAPPPLLVDFERERVRPRHERAAGSGS